MKMDKRYLAFTLALAIFFVAMPSLIRAAGQALTVQLQTTQLRAAPSFTSKPVATLSHGQSVTVLEEQAPWLMVTATGGRGWLHQNAVADRRSSLLSGSRDAAAKADAREVSMAGKGFDQQTEQAYRKGNPQGYADVEKMLRFSFRPEESMAFLAAGQGRTQ
jgi:uncharacterized protein YraI